MTSQKDYVAVAHSLRQARETLERDIASSFDLRTVRIIMDELTMNLAGYFARDNPRFSVGKFSDAAGVPTSREVEHESHN